MLKYTLRIIALLSLCALAAGLTGCTVTTYGSGYNYAPPPANVQARIFSHSGTERPYYRPLYY